MKCPRCQTLIFELSKTCEFCHYAFDDSTFKKLSVYFDLKKDINLLKDNVDAGIQKIKQRLQNYEEFLEEDIQNLVVLEKPIPAEKKVLPLDNKVQTEAVEIKCEKNVPETKVESVRVSQKKTFDFESRLGQKWLLIIGIITMVLGVGYFLKYSFDKGWVTPAGRVALSYLWGVMFLFGGDQIRKRKYELFGLYLIGGGIAVLYFSTFAAFQIYHLFSFMPSFIIMIVTTGLASALAIKYNTKWLAVLGLIGGFGTPIFLSTGQDNLIGLMAYVTILNIGILGIAFYKEWNMLNKLGFVLTYFLFGGWFIEYYSVSKFLPSIVFLNTFFFIYSIIPFAYQFFRSEKIRTRNFSITMFNSFIAFGYNFFMIEGKYSLEWVSVVVILYSLYFLILASLMYKRMLQYQEAFIVYIAKATLFLVIAVPIIFSKHWITIFWAAEAIAVFWAGGKLSKRDLILGAYVLCGITLGKLLFYDYTVVFNFNIDSFCMDSCYTDKIIERYIASVFVLCVLYFFARLSRRFQIKFITSASLTLKSDFPVVISLWGILLFVVCNVEVASFFHDYLNQARFAAISILWALFAVVLIIKGFKDNISVVRKTALWMFFITILKVFIFDMEKVDTPFRILSFILVGLLLIGASYLYYKFKDKFIEKTR